MRKNNNLHMQKQWRRSAAQNQRISFRYTSIFFLNTKPFSGSLQPSLSRTLSQTQIVGFIITQLLSVLISECIAESLYHGVLHSLISAKEASL